MKREPLCGLLCCFLASWSLASPFKLDIYARQFEHETPIVNGKIYSVVDDQETLLATTNEKGLATIYVDSSEPLTLFIEGYSIESEAHWLFSWLFYPSTKNMIAPLSIFIELFSGILSTPRIYSGLIYPGEKDYTGEYGRITFQVPYEAMISYLHRMLAMHFSSEARPNHCQLVTTVTPEDKSLKDCPHGLSEVKVMMQPSKYEARYYFDVLRRVPPHFCKTDLFVNLGTVPILVKGGKLVCSPMSQMLDINCTEEVNGVAKYFGIDALDREVTSEDGGVMFLNIPARSEPYTISSYKPGYSFEEVKFICRPDALINISPPQGPMGKKLSIKDGGAQSVCPTN